MRTLFYLAVLATGLSLAAACGGGDDVTSPQPVAQPTVWTVATEPTAPPVAPAQPTAAPVVPAVAPVEPAVSPTNGVIKVTSLNRDPGGTGKGKYVFDPDEFTFNVGDVVEFTLNAETEFHTFTVDDLDIDVSLDPRFQPNHDLYIRQAGRVQADLHPARVSGNGGVDNSTPIDCLTHRRNPISVSDLLATGWILGAPRNSPYGPRLISPKLDSSTVKEARRCWT